MRTNIVHPGAGELSYEIREIVEVAKKFESLGMPIIWENIGDPVAKGEYVPEWIKEKVTQAVQDDASYGYSPTLGLLPTREYIAKERNLEGGIQITPDDILFCNGLGDAISVVYEHLAPSARVIGPRPAYPTHSSAEAAHSGKPHITYELVPERGWEPNLEEIESKVKENSDIAGIIIINPDNPTGYVYSQETLAKIVAIAKKHGLFLIVDEIYSNLSFPESGMRKLASVIGDVPAIAMRGISKEFPWPGARCGWLEFYNRDKDEMFNTYTRSIINAKMLEVCSTTLPQKVLPEVMSDERYYPYLAERIAKYESRAKYAQEVLGEIPELIVNPVQGAFYMTVVFKSGTLNERQTLAVEDGARLAYLSTLLEGLPLDKRFVYHLLASKGVCVVPLSSGFNSPRNGFRFTLLEQNEERFKEIIQTIAGAVRAYIGSTT